MLVNVNEEIVKQRIEILLKDYDCCKCEKCVNDMMALALNNVKPAYVNTNEGVLFKRIDSTKLQHSTDLDIEIIKAIELVKRNPKHIEPPAAVPPAEDNNEQPEQLSLMGDDEKKQAKPRTTRKKTTKSGNTTKKAKKSDQAAQADIDSSEKETL